MACFQRVMDNIIKENQLTSTYAYLDDVMVCGEDKQSHDDNLQRFMAVAERLGLTLNTKKCIYEATEIAYVGYLISHEKLRPDPQRFQVIDQMADPSDQNSLLRAIGFFAYYSRWIPHYSTKIRPLLDVKQFPFNGSAKEAFDSLRNDIKKASLSPFVSNRPILVETDASDTAIGAVLSQDNRPVAFFPVLSINLNETKHQLKKKPVLLWMRFVIGVTFCWVDLLL